MSAAERSFTCTWLHPGQEARRCNRLNKYGERCRNKAVERDGACVTHANKQTSAPKPEKVKAAPKTLEPLPAGMRVGRLRVVEFIGGDDYLCECDCGAPVKRARHSIVRAKNTAINSACPKCLRQTQHKNHFSTCAPVFMKRSI